MRLGRVESAGLCIRRPGYIPAGQSVLSISVCRSWAGRVFAFSKIGGSGDGGSEPSIRVGSQPLHQGYLGLDRSCHGGLSCALCSGPDLYPLDARITQSPAVIARMSPDVVRCPRQVVCVCTCAKFPALENHQGREVKIVMVEVASYVSLFLSGSQIPL